MKIIFVSLENITMITVKFYPYQDSTVGEAYMLEMVPNGWHTQTSFGTKWMTGPKLYVDLLSLKH